MSHRTKLESGTFRQQAVGEIMAELQLENDKLVKALVDMRLPSSHALRQRVRTITNVERARRIGKASVSHPEQMLPFLRRLVLRASAVAAILLVAVVLLIATVPSVRASFDRIIQQRFGLVLVESTQEVMTATETELEEGEILTEVTIPSISLEEVQGQVPFTIPMPTILPEGLEMWAARVGAGPHGESMDEDGNRIVIEPPVKIILHFKPDEESRVRYHPEATLGLEIFDQIDLAGGYAIQTGNEKEVAVNNSSAVFVQGAWTKIEENEPLDSNSMIWDATADAAMLSWEANGFTYVLSGSYLGLSQEDYIRIAESVVQS